MGSKAEQAQLQQAGLVLRTQTSQYCVVAFLLWRGPGCRGPPVIFYPHVVRTWNYEVLPQRWVTQEGALSETSRNNTVDLSEAWQTSSSSSSSSCFSPSLLPLFSPHCLSVPLCPLHLKFQHVLLVWCSPLTASGYVSLQLVFHKHVSRSAKFSVNLRSWENSFPGTLHCVQQLNYAKGFTADGVKEWKLIQWHS